MNQECGRAKAAGAEQADVWDLSGTMFDFTNFNIRQLKGREACPTKLTPYFLPSDKSFKLGYPLHRFEELLVGGICSGEISPPSCTY